MVYRLIQPCPVRTILSTDVLVNDYDEAHSSDVDVDLVRGYTPPITMVRSWTPPPADTIKVNIDGAWDKITKKGGAGAVLRNSSGDLVCGISNFFVANSALEAEARSLILGLKAAQSSNCRSIVVECDNRTLVDSLGKCTSKCSWSIFPFLCEFHRLKMSFQGISWTWVTREANRAADAAAKLAKLRLCMDDWTANPPTSISIIMTTDGYPQTSLICLHLWLVATRCPYFVLWPGLRLLATTSCFFPSVISLLVLFSC